MDGASGYMGTIMDHHLSGVQGLVHLWNKSGIQIMVLLSFGMQVFLLVFGATRRRSSSAFLRLSLWLVYLLADSTAIYALGHLSVASGGGSSEHQLVSFWAPFLLLHLGGPDNITAYSLEDNRLWQRHLQILIVQVLGAAYVTYKSMSGGGTMLLLLASISMFVVGLAKYGERTWALKCSTISSIRSSLRFQDTEEPCQLLTRDMSDEDILLVAHRSLHICKAVFTDFPVWFSRDGYGSTRRDCVVSQYKLVEMELSLMYDALYTKAAVIHTWYGFCIRIVSVLGTATAFLLFHIHLTRTSSRGNNNGYKGGDVIVSYVLLVGALVLEAMSLCKALVSSWTRSLLHSHSHRGHRWEWLLHALIFLGQRVQRASSRRWQGSIGQYNLFHLCTRDSKKLGSRLAKNMRLEDWWNKLHFTSTFTPTDDFKELLVDQSVPLLFYCDPRGTSILKQKRLLESFDPAIFGRDFTESILIWSIVTEKCIHLTKHKQEEEEEQGKRIQAIEVLCNYLMFLLVVKPEMLPDPRPQKAHADLCHVCDHIWSYLHRHDDDERNSKAASQKSWSPFNVLKKQFQRLNKLFHQDGPNASRIEQRKELLSNMFNPVYEYEHALTLGMESNYRADLICYKARHIWEALARKTNWSEALEIMLAVWVEMLVYAAEHCSRDSHARNLTDKGGEFITVLWLLVKHDKFSAIYSWPKEEPPLPPPAPPEEPMAEAEPLQLGEIDEEELKQYDGSDPTKPLLMAIKGQIYDVTQSSAFYGPRGPYSLFAAKDASRGLAKMSFEPEDLTSDISCLEPFELDALQDWEDKFMSKYAKVGTIKKSIPLPREKPKALPSI